MRLCTTNLIRNLKPHIQKSLVSLTKIKKKHCERLIKNKIKHEIRREEESEKKQSLTLFVNPIIKHKIITQI